MTSIQNRLKAAADTTFKVSYEGKEGVDTPRFIISYWSIRGLCAPLRMMLSAAEVNHWVILYDVSEGEEGSWVRGEAYFNDKKWLKEEYNSLINLPFLVDCRYDRVIAQTNAIFSYLGRELDMLGKNKREQSKCEELLCEVMDLRDKMVGFSYNTDVEKAQTDAESLAKQAAAYLDKFELCLERENPERLKTKKTYDDDKLTAERAKDGICYLVGGRLSAPDFHLWEMLDQFEGLCKTYNLPALWSKKLRPHLYDFKNNFEVLPENVEFLVSDPDHPSYKRSFLASLPYNNPYARFGSDPSTLGKFTRGQDTWWRSNGEVIDIRTARRNSLAPEKDVESACKRVKLEES